MVPLNGKLIAAQKLRLLTPGAHIVCDRFSAVLPHGAGHTGGVSQAGHTADGEEDAQEGLRLKEGLAPTIRKKSVFSHSVQIYICCHSCLIL